VRDTFAHLLDGRGRELAGPLTRGATAQPIWTTAPRANGRRVARRTVRAATGGTVEVRMRRPAGRLQVAATVR
jgi:hypothetical protein